MPAETPGLGLPFPLPEDALVDYPALGQELAEKVEAMLGLVPQRIAELDVTALLRAEAQAGGETKPTGEPRGVASIILPGLPQTFRHLRIVASLRTGLAGQFWETIELRLNGDAGLNYQTVRLRGAAPNATAIENLNASGVQMSAYAGQTLRFSPFVIDLPGYLDATSPQGIIFSTGWMLGAPPWVIEHGMGEWGALAPVDTVGFHPMSAGQFQPGSIVSVYGLP
jgi:hypothetical protein